MPPNPPGNPLTDEGKRRGKGSRRSESGQIKAMFENHIDNRDNTRLYGQGEEEPEKAEGDQAERGPGAPR
jgi:hypothetical protein